MTLARRSVLLTGFEPFPTQPVNATAILAPALARACHRLFPDVRVRAEVLPTEWQRGPWALQDAILSETPDVVLSFGIASRARGFEIETRAQNATSDAKDACGVVGECQPLDDGAPDLRAAKLPVSDILRRLRARRIPAIPSRNAGKYICNATLFHAIGLTVQFPRLARVGFIHLPAELPVPGRRHTEVNRSSPLSWDQAVVGGLEIVAACLGRPIALQALARWTRDQKIALRRPL